MKRMLNDLDIQQIQFCVQSISDTNKNANNDIKHHSTMKVGLGESNIQDEAFYGISSDNDVNETQKMSQSHQHGNSGSDLDN